MGKKTNEGQVAAMNAAIAEQKTARAKLDAVKEPDYQQIEDYIRAAAAENPELMGLYEAIQRDPSALENIVSDPSLRGTQLAALESLREAGESGFTEEDMAKRRGLQREVASGEKARQASILQQMAERGQSGAGAELAARLSSSQQATQRASEAGDRLSTDAASARRQALMQASQAAGSLRQQDYGEQSNLASAKDQIAQFNAMNRQSAADRNLQLRQSMEGQRSGQTQQMYGQLGNLQQQKFGNQMQKAGAYVNATQPIASMTAQNVSKSQGPLGTIGALAGTAAGAFFGKTPQAAQAGGQIGGALGGSMQSNNSGSFADGGVKSNRMYGSLERYANVGRSGEPTEMTPERAMKRNQILRELIKDKGATSIDNDRFLGRIDLTSDEKQMLLLERLKTQEDPRRIEQLERYIIENTEAGIKYADGGIKPSHVPSMDDYSARYEKEQFKKRELEGKFGGDRYLQAQSGEAGISTADALHSAKQGLGSISDKIKGLIGTPSESTEPKKESLVSGLSKMGKALTAKPSQSPELQLNSSPVIDEDALSELRTQKLIAADGGVKEMAYNDGGMGTIIASGEESYAGDELDDSLNDGEMVLNLDMQESINNQLLELKRLKSGQRTDTMVDDGDKSINPGQQDSLLAIARGEMDVSEMPEERIISEPTGGMGELLALIRKSKRS